MIFKKKDDMSVDELIERHDIEQAVRSVIIYLVVMSGLLGFVIFAVLKMDGVR